MKRPKNLGAYVIFIMHKSTIIISLTLFLLATGCNNAMSNNVTKFEWDATESAPEHYPMKIISGTFIYKGEAERGLYIPDGGTLVDGWGDSISSHVTGDKYKPLPDRLTITFFSNAENQFYKGEFKLPYDKILALFQEGVAAKNKIPAYSSVMVGIAPGGAVSVWVIGKGGYIEVFFGQAEKVDLNPSVAFALPFEDKAQETWYIEKQLTNVLSPEEIKHLKTNGIPFGLWARYRHLYEWEPVLAEGFTMTYVGFEFLNGERNDSEGMVSRPVPREVAFKTVINDKRRIFFVTFDEFEIMDAFEKLGANNQKVYLEFEPRLPRETTRVRIYNDKESITLKKFKSKK